MLHCGTAVIEDGEFVLGQSRRQWTTLAAAQGLMGPPLKHFSHHFAGTERAEQDEHGRCSWLEQLSEPARNGFEVDNTVEGREVGKRTIEKPSVVGEMIGSEILEFFPGCAFSSSAKRGQLSLCQCHHRGRRIGQKHFVAGVGEKRCIFTCAASEFQNMTLFRESTLQYLADGTPLCRDALPSTESAVEDRGNRVKSRGGRSHGQHRCGGYFWWVQRCYSNLSRMSIVNLNAQAPRDQLVFITGTTERYSQRTWPRFEDLSCWCKAIVTILLLRLWNKPSQEF